MGQAKRWVLRLSLIVLGFAIFAWLYFKITPLPGQFPVYVDIPNGCWTTGQDMIAFTENNFFARPGVHLVTIECDDGEYTVSVEVQGGRNHAKWEKGDKKMWMQYD